MNRSYLMWLICLLLVIESLTSEAVAQAQADLRSLTALRSKTITARKAAAEEIRTRRTALVKALLELAESARDQGQLHSSRESAVALLGSFRAVEAAPLLVRHIAMRFPGYSTEMTPAAGYSCARSLIKIGTPGVHAILSRMRENVEPSQRELALYALVIRTVDGYDLGLKRLDLERQGEIVYDHHRRNLTELLAVYKKKPFVP